MQRGLLKSFVKDGENTLKNKYKNYSLTELSMGMSNDYHEALNHGSTMIRVGSALFK